MDLPRRGAARDDGSPPRRIARGRPRARARVAARLDARIAFPELPHDHATKVPRKVYERELMRLQAELVKLKEWVRTSGVRVVVVFEGRDAAGKGGAIKRISEYLNPRAARIVALPAPPNASAGSGTSSATSRICRRQERSSCSI